MIPVAGEWSKLANMHTDEADHLTEALRYACRSAFMQIPVQRSYACECKLCGITQYTSYKRLNCEYCGCDSNQFTCRELK